MGASRRSSSAGRGSGSPAPSTRSRGGDTSGASTPRSALSHASSFNGSSRGDRALQGGGPMRSSSTGRAAGPRPSQGPGAGRHNSTGGSRGGSPYHHSSSSDMGRPGSATRQLQQRPGSSASSRDQLGAVYGVDSAWGGSRSSSRQRSDRIPDRDKLASGEGVSMQIQQSRALSDFVHCREAVRYAVLLSHEVVTPPPRQCCSRCVALSGMVQGMARDRQV
jgi:hypothetical protein